MDQTRCYAGLDCGGTKTTVSIFRHDGVLLFESKYLQQSQYARFSDAKQFCEHIHLILELAKFQMIIKPKTPFLFISMSVGGLNTQKMEQAVTETYNNTYPHDADMVIFSHDSIGATFAIFPSQTKCLALISGTGSIATVVSNGEIIARSSGNGYMVDDKGSAFDIGNVALKMLIQYFESLNNFNQLKKYTDNNIDLPEYIFKKTGFSYDDHRDLLKTVNLVKKIDSIDDIYEIYYPLPDPTFISSFAEVIGSSACNGLPVCVKLVQQAAIYLAKHILDILPIYVKDKSNVEFINRRCVVNLVCAGSIINNFKCMKYDFFKELYKYPDPNSIYLRMVCINDVSSYGAANFGHNNYIKKFPRSTIKPPKVKLREPIDLYSGPLSAAIMFP